MDIIAQLRSTVEQFPPDTQYDENVFHELEHLKSELNDYSKAVSTPIGERNLTPYVMMGKSDILRNHFKNQNKNVPRFYFENVKGITESDWRYSQSRLFQIKHILPKVGLFSTNPWRGTSPWVILPSDIDDVKGRIVQCRELLYEFLDSLEHLVSECGMAPIFSYDDLRNSGPVEMLIGR